MLTLSARTVGWKRCLAARKQQSHVIVVLAAFWDKDVLFGKPVMVPCDIIVARIEIFVWRGGDDEGIEKNIEAAAPSSNLLRKLWQAFVQAHLIFVDVGFGVEHAMRLDKNDALALAYVVQHPQDKVWLEAVSFEKADLPAPA